MWKCFPVGSVGLGKDDTFPNLDQQISALHVQPVNLGLPYALRRTEESIELLNLLQKQSLEAQFSNMKITENRMTIKVLAKHM